MKRMQIPTIGAIVCLILCSCGHLQGEPDTDAAMRDLYKRGKAMMEQQDPDSAMSLMLDAADMASTCNDADIKYHVYEALSELYEEKNLSAQQQDAQHQMQQAAHAMRDKTLEAKAMQRMAMTSMVMGQTDTALQQAHKAYRLICADSTSFRAQTMLLLCQIYLQREQTDSAYTCLERAATIDPHIKGTDMYRISHTYTLTQLGQNAALQGVIHEYMLTGSIYSHAELARLLCSIYESEGRWQDAYRASQQLVTLTDSISATEASQSTTRIHRLQHQRRMDQMQQQKHQEMLQQRIHYYIIVVGVLCLLLAASVVASVYRRRAIKAHERELDAMQIAETAQENELQTREENVLLQQRYYEHLYAIILPILNARRGKAGHIDLEEESWRLIESNTDMVLPGFTRKLRRNHPNLSTEDIRFCCMLMMRVPNAILADIYGIAPTSVAVRKQRMKKKLDADVQDLTIENYLNQYTI